MIGSALNQRRRPHPIHRLAALAAATLVAAIVAPAALADMAAQRTIGPVAAPRVVEPALAPVAGAVFSYEIDRTTRPGPGLSSLAPRDAASMTYPSALIDWQPSERLSVTAGRQLCNSAGPSAHAIYALADHIDMTLGFRFERTRFRLTPQPGSDLGSIGVEQSAPAFATLRFGPPHAFVALVAGAELRGKVRIEDERGGFLAERLDRPSPFAGIAGRLTF